MEPKVKPQKDLKPSLVALQWIKFENYRADSETNTLNPKATHITCLLYW